MKRWLSFRSLSILEGMFSPRASECISSFLTPISGKACILIALDRSIFWSSPLSLSESLTLMMELEFIDILTFWLDFASWVSLKSSLSTTFMVDASSNILAEGYSDSGLSSLRVYIVYLNDDAPWVEAIFWGEVIAGGGWVCWSDVYINNCFDEDIVGNIFKDKI